jgi:activator of HSP90 ATPase
MAKVGEGDPRWIVQERSDGANVNNWHWTELDCSAWAKERLTNLLGSIAVSEGDKSFNFSVESITGEASVNTRKGKVLFFYELEAKLKYQGSIQGSDDKCEGKVHIPYIGDENADGEIEVKVTCDGKTTSDAAIKDFVYSKARAVLSAKVIQFLQELREEQGPKNLKPTATAPAVRSTSATTTSSSHVNTKPETTPSTTTATPKQTSVSTQKVTLKVKFKGPVDEVFSCLLDPNRVSMFTQANATLSPTPGTPFSLYGGVITGEILDVQKNTKIVQKWRMQDWPEGHYSQVTLAFEPGKEGTTLNLTQTGVPTSDVDRIKAGWDEKFWRRMKMMFGWGSLFE